MNWQKDIMKTHKTQSGYFKKMQNDENPNNFCIEDPVIVKSSDENTFGIITDVDVHVQECKVKCTNEKHLWVKFSELAHMEDPEIEVDCENCDDGKIEGLINCNRATSDCCGGCFENEPCEECEGSGKKMAYIDVIIDEIKWK